MSFWKFFSQFLKTQDMLKSTNFRGSWLIIGSVKTDFDLFCTIFYTTLDDIAKTRPKIGLLFQLIRSFLRFR